MDEIFHDVSGLKGALDVVKVSLIKPRRYGKKGELLINYNDTEEARNAERRRSSLAPQPGKVDMGGVAHDEKADSNGSG